MKTVVANRKRNIFRIYRMRDSITKNEYDIHGLTHTSNIVLNIFWRYMRAYVGMYYSTVEGNTYFSLGNVSIRVLPSLFFWKGHISPQWGPSGYATEASGFDKADKFSRRVSSPIAISIHKALSDSPRGSVRQSAKALIHRIAGQMSIG